jgi:succinyl-diaminopimelate desuccinylase
MTTHPAIDLLVDLIKRPSITPDDAGCQDLIAARLADLGFTCEPMPFGDVNNLWARIGSNSPVLCFAGHTDVVPPGNLSNWTSDPFDPAVRDGLLYGRGAADMKGGIAAMVVAAENFVATHPDFTGSLAFLITSDEEGLAVNGTKRVMETLISRNERIDWCVVGEPSSDKTLGDTVRIGRRGSLTGSVTIRGIQGHVAYAHLARNPIKDFAPALTSLLEYQWDNGNDNFPPTTFEMVQIDTGTGADNVLPAKLTARFNFRYSTEWHHSGIERIVTEILDSQEIDYDIEWILSGEPFLTTPGALTAAVRQTVVEITENEPTFSTGGGTSDGRFISPAGADVIELGLINATIHKIDEHVKVDHIPTLCNMYERIMQLLLAKP